MHAVLSEVQTLRSSTDTLYLQVHDRCHQSLSAFLHPVDPGMTEVLVLLTKINMRINMVNNFEFTVLANNCKLMFAHTYLVC